MARSTLNSADENLQDKVITPAALIGASPEIVDYTRVKTGERKIGYRSPRYLIFDRTAPRCADLSNLIPVLRGLGPKTLVPRFGCSGMAGFFALLLCLTLAILNGVFNGLI